MVVILPVSPLMVDVADGNPGGAYSQPPTNEGDLPLSAGDEVDTVVAGVIRSTIELGNATWVSIQAARSGVEACGKGRDGGPGDVAVALDVVTRHDGEQCGPARRASRPGSTRPRSARGSAGT